MDTIRDLAVTLGCVAGILMSFVYIGETYRLTDTIHSGISKSIASLPRPTIP